MIIVNLSPQWLEFCHHEHKKRAHPHKQQNKHHRENSIIDLIGVIGEVATALCYGVDIDTGIGGDSGHDMIIDGKRVDVKTAELTGRYLPSLMVEAGPAKADVYILAEIAMDHPKNVYIVGWATPREMVAKGTRKKMKRNSVYLLHREKLNHFPNKIFIA